MHYTIDLNKVSLKDIGLVGGKNASLGEMLQNIKSLGIKVPNGFAITTEAYHDFIKHNSLDEKINELISGLDDGDLAKLRWAGSETS
jgi:pyruvate,water dikinase